MADCYPMIKDLLKKKGGIRETIEMGERRGMVNWSGGWLLFHY